MEQDAKQSGNGKFATMEDTLGGSIAQQRRSRTSIGGYALTCRLQ